MIQLLNSSWVEATASSHLNIMSARTPAWQTQGWIVVMVSVVRSNDHQAVDRIRNGRWELGFNVRDGPILQSRAPTEANEMKHERDHFPLLTHFSSFIIIVHELWNFPAENWTVKGTPSRRFQEALSWTSLLFCTLMEISDLKGASQFSLLNPTFARQSHRAGEWGQHLNECGTFLKCNPFVFTLGKCS